MTWISILMVIFSSLFFNFFEGISYYVMGKRYNKNFRWYQGVGCSYYCAFFKLSTFGSGTAAAGIYYLNGYKVSPANSLGMITINYIIQKVAVVLLCIIFFISHFSIMENIFGEYFVYIIWGVVATILLAVALLVVVMCKKFHDFLIFLGDKVFRKETIKEALHSVEEQLTLLREESKIMIKEKSTLIKLLVLNMIKFLGWYMIPCIIIGYNNVNEILFGLSIAALASALVGVIPAPGAAGSTEAVFYALFSVVAIKSEAIAAMLMYRCFTYIFPFIVGAIFIFIKKTINKFYARSNI